MSKFNQPVTLKTKNKSGHAAYDMKDKDKLVTMVLTTFFNEAKYYGDNSNELVELAQKVAEYDPRFVSNLAIYARKEMHLRSVSHVLTSIVAHTVESKPFIRETVEGVVERADDITEILACYISMYGKPVPNGLKKGLNDAMKRFNAFAFSKYNGGNKAIKFRDVLRICHPKADTDKQNQTFKMILDDTLPIAKRWETELSARGNTKEVWEELIGENRIGYMAALRNLRNMLNVGPSNIQKIYDKLSNKEEVLKSKQLPFRFLSAYKNLPPEATSKVRDVLEDACEYSIENLPKIPGKTVIAIDTSGSMWSRISYKSDVRCDQIALMLGLIANKLCEEAIVYAFDTKISEMAVSHRSGIISTVLSCDFGGGGTDLTLPLRRMINNDIVADRLIMISDNEINSSWRGFAKTCQSYADQYRNQVNPDLWVHAIDLQGYGTQQFIGGKTNIIAGWSERVFEFISLAEQGIESQVERIQNYHIGSDL